MDNVNKALNELGDKLQSEADVKINEVVELYNKCPEDLKKFVCQMLRVPYGDEAALRETLDTYELMDTLDVVKDNIQSNLELETE